MDIMSKIKDIYQYLKGEFWCRHFHKPLFFNIGGYGGRNIFGQSRKTYKGYSCIKCNIDWESERQPKWDKLPHEEKWIITEKFKNL